MGQAGGGGVTPFPTVSHHHAHDARPLYVTWLAADDALAVRVVVGLHSAGLQKRGQRSASQASLVAS